MTKTINTLTMIAMIVIIGLSPFCTGCFDESENKEKYITYSEYAGTAAGYLINHSGKILGPETKTVIISVVNEIATTLPSEVTSETISDEMTRIASNVIAKADISPQYVEVVTKSVDTLLTMLKTALNSIKDKYPVEFGNAEIFYSIAYAFFNSANDVIDDDVSKNVAEEVEFTIEIPSFKEVKKIAKTDGVKLNRNAFEDIISKLEELSK